VVSASGVAVAVCRWCTAAIGGRWCCWEMTSRSLSNAACRHTHRIGLPAPFSDDMLADTVAAQSCATMKQCVTIHAHCKPGMHAGQLVLQCQQHKQCSVALKHDGISRTSGPQNTTLHSLITALRCHVGWHIMSDDRAAADSLIEMSINVSRHL